MKKRALKTVFSLMSPGISAVIILLALFAIHGISVAGIDEWSPLGLKEQSVNAIVPDWSYPDLIYAGTDRGVYITEDGGHNWEYSGLMGVNDIAIPMTDATLIFAAFGCGSFSDGIWVSNDGGETWDVSFWSFHCRTLCLDESHGGTIYAGSLVEGVLKTTDWGKRWELKNNGLENTEVYDIIVNPVNTGIVYAATACGIFRSPNGAEEWEWIGPHMVKFTSLDMHPRDPERVYATMGEGCESDGVWISDDGGDTWDVSYWIGLASSVLVDPYKPEHIMAASLECGLIRSFDRGVTKWTEWNQGLPNKNRAMTCISRNPGIPWVYYAGSRGAGLFVYSKSLDIFLAPEETVLHRGETLTFSGVIRNYLDHSIRINVWVDARLPDGRVIGPLLGPVPVMIEGGGWVEGTIGSGIPAHAPLGDYILYVRAGETYPDVTEASSFGFTVIE